MCVNLHYILFIKWDAVHLSKCRWVIWHKVFETLSTMLSISSQSLMVLTIICYFSKSSGSAVAAEPDDKVSITVWLKAMVLCGWISDGWIYFSTSPSFSVFIIFSQLYSFAYLRSTAGKIECFGYYWQFLVR